MDAPFPEGLMPCIEAFLATDAQRPAGQDLYDEVFATDLFFPLQRKNELRKTIQRVRPLSPTVIGDIGSDKGGGLYHWCKCLPGLQRVFACEIRGLPYRYLFEKNFPHIDFFWLEDSSYAPPNVRRVRDWLGNDQFDFVFIDGDKPAFRQDYDSYRPNVKKGGLVLVHDVTDETPGRAFYAVAEALGDGHWETIVDREESYAILQRMVEGGRIENPYEGWLEYWQGRSCGVGVIHVD